MSTRRRIRPAERSDTEALNAIYNWYVLNSAATFEMTVVSTDARLRWLDEHSGDRYRVLVAVEMDRAVGFASSSRYRSRAAYDTTVETSVYVAHDHLGSGIGHDLYASLFGDLAGEDVHRACAGITLPNPASENLHRRFGFRPVGRFTEQGRKFGSYWDVAWLEKDLSRAPY